MKFKKERYEEQVNTEELTILHEKLFPKLSGTYNHA